MLKVQDILKYQKFKSRDLLNEMIEDNKGLLFDLAHKFGGSRGLVEDYYNEAVCGFIKGLNKFDIERHTQGTNPISIIYYYILTEMNNNSLNMRVPFSLPIKVKTELCKVNRTDTFKKIPAKFKNLVNVRYISGYVEGDEGFKQIDIPQFDENYNEIENKILLNSLLSNLTREDAKFILKLYTCDTVSAYAKELGRSRQYIYEKKHKILSKIRTFNKIEMGA